MSLFKMRAFCARFAAERTKAVDASLWSLLEWKSMNTQTNRQPFLDLVHPFENKWVALDDDEVIASGATVAEVKEKADRTGRKNYVFYFVPSSASSFAPHTL